MREFTVRARFFQVQNKRGWFAPRCTLSGSKGNSKPPNGLRKLQKARRARGFPCQFQGDLGEIKPFVVFDDWICPSFPRATQLITGFIPLTSLLTPFEQNPHP
jgi:hypothetical protein